MVWTPPKKPVNVNRMIIYSFIPFLNIYAAWRIQIFWVLVVDTTIGFGHAFGSALLVEILPFPYDVFLSLATALSISALMAKHYGFPLILSLLYVIGAGIMIISELLYLTLMLSIPVSILISVLVIRYRVRKYNEKIKSAESNSP